MKKGIQLFAILIASLALFVATGIPHHHHEDDICFENSHRDAACDHQDHSSAKNNHEAEKAEDHHDSEKSEDHHNCLLDIEILLPPQQNDNEVENFIYLDESPGIDGIATLLTNFYFEDQILHGQQISHSPPILQYHSRCVIGSPGLRAPPVC